MVDLPQQPEPLALNTEPEELPPLSSAPTEPIPSQLDPTPIADVVIPLEDVQHPVEEVNQPAAAEAALRQAPELHHQATPDEVHAHNEQVKQAFLQQVLEARRQAAAPPPPPQPVARGIVDQTAREMAAGAKQSAYWAEQQKSRPAPNERDRQAAGLNTPVFQPTSYTHERGEGYDGKQASQSSLPSR